LSCGKWRGDFDQIGSPRYAGKWLHRFVGADCLGSPPALARELRLLFIGLEFAVEGKRGGNENEIFLFDARIGAIRWRIETRGSIRHAPAFDKTRGLAVTGCADGCIYIIDVETGSEVWSVQTANTIYTPSELATAWFTRLTDLPLRSRALISFQTRSPTPSPIMPKTGAFYALTYVNQLFAFARVEC
jgi:hypothetical protein